MADSKINAAVPAGTAEENALLFPDNASGNAGLCQKLASDKAMPNDTATEAQKDAQGPAAASYTTDPTSTIFHALPNITNPVMVIAGTLDDILSIEDDYMLVNRIPGASFLQFPDAGHAAITQHAVTCGQVISAFLDDVS